MYLDEADKEDELRQGDVVSNVHLLGAIQVGGIQISSNQEGKPMGWIVPAEPKYGHAMVLSHNCEIDTGNVHKVTSCILAPIRDVEKASDKDKIQTLIESNLLDKNKHEGSFLKYFYLNPHDDFEGVFQKGAIVDFSKCFSVHKKYLPVLADKKILQLSAEVANQMALKMAVFIYRENNLAA